MPRTHRRGLDRHASEESAGTEGRRLIRVDGGRLGLRHARVAHANAKHTWTEREGLVLVLRGEGLEGVGEASPLPGYSSDDLVACRAELDRCWARLPALDPDADVHATMRDAVSRAGVRAPAAVFAVESAILDLVSRARGRPAWAVLRGDDHPPPVAVSALAEGPTPETLADAAERARDRGITVVKVKVGGPDGERRDPPRLRAIRARLGDTIGLRLDANQTLPLERLDELLARLAEHGPELLEEPSTPECFRVLEKSPFPLAMDESLLLDGWQGRIGDAAARGTCAAVVLKPMVLGGFAKSLAVAEVAAKAGLAALVTHVFDGPVGSAAAACLALSLRGEVLPCGLDAHGRLEQAVPAIGPTALIPYAASGLALEQIAYDEVTGA